MIKYTSGPWEMVTPEKHYGMNYKKVLQVKGSRLNFIANLEFHKRVGAPEENDAEINATAKVIESAPETR